MKKHKGRLTVKWTNWTFGIWWDPKKLRAWGIDFGPIEYVYACKPRHVVSVDPGRPSGYGLFQVMTSKHVSPESYIVCNLEALEKIKKWTDPS